MPQRAKLHNPLLKKKRPRRHKPPRLYDKRSWRRLSQAWLYSNPLCVQCGDAACQVDHIEPHKGNLELFFSGDNLQSLCRRCHGIKSKSEQ